MSDPRNGCDQPITCPFPPSRAWHHEQANFYIAEHRRFKANDEYMEAQEALDRAEQHADFARADARLDRDAARTLRQLVDALREREDVAHRIDALTWQLSQWFPAATAYHEPDSQLPF